DTTTTQLASYLGTFLDLLAQNGDLVNANLNLGANPQYKNAFCQTPLYTGTSLTCGVNYSAVFSSTVLNAKLDDGKGYACAFSLELINPSGIFDFTKVTHFINLRHDPTHIVAGAHYDFLVTARM